MPYKDKKKQAAAQKRHYEKNKDYYINKKSERQKKIRDFINDYKSDLKCERCSETHIGCLEFHHENPNEKEICISEICRTGWGQERILKEIDKCIVLCANCHRKLHWQLKNN